MPASYLMSWESKSHRWWKQYKSWRDVKPKRYVISCRQLSKWSGKPIPATKEGSYQAANQWWIAKRAEIDGAAPPHPHADEIAELRKRRDWSHQQENSTLAGFWERQANILEAHPEAPSILEQNRELRLYQTKRLYGVDLSHVPQEMLDHLAYDAVSAAQIERDKPETTPVDKTIKTVLSRYLAERVTSKVDDGELSLSDYNLTRLASEFFAEFIGADTSIDSINAEMIDRYWRHIRDNGGSVSLKMKRLRFVRRFVRWLATLELIPRIPLNLDDRTHTFKQSHKAIVTVEKEDVRRLVDAARGQLKLHMLLMLNTGMGQADIAHLKQSEVDWTQGRIIRKRWKTRNHPNVPIVDYKLWPITFALLQKYREKEGQIVVLTRTKGPWTSERLKENGKVSKTDNIRTNYDRLAEKLGIETTLKHFRKTSASLLKTHRDYQTFDVEFLDHAPNTMATIYYSAPSKELFDEAVTWLGKQYGFIA